MSDFRTHGGDSAVDDEDTEFPFTEERCPGHASFAGRDPKVCGYCGVHVDSFRPPEEGDAL